MFLIKLFEEFSQNCEIAVKRAIGNSPIKRDCF